MVATYFQRFFKWPGAPKKEPQGQPNVIFRVSFVDLCPNVVQGKGNPGGAQGSPKGVQGGAKRAPRETKGDPKRVQGNPKGFQGEPRGTKNRSRGAPAGHGSGKAAGSWMYIYMYIIYIHEELYRNSKKKGNCLGI